MYIGKVINESDETFKYIDLLLIFLRGENIPKTEITKNEATILLFYLLRPICYNLVKWNFQDEKRRIESSRTLSIGKSA